MMTTAGGIRTVACTVKLNGFSSASSLSKATVPLSDVRHRAASSCSTNVALWSMPSVVAENGDARLNPAGTLIDSLK